MKRVLLVLTIQLDITLVCFFTDKKTRKQKSGYITTITTIQKSRHNTNETDDKSLDKREIIDTDGKKFDII